MERDGIAQGDMRWKAYVVPRVCLSLSHFFAGAARYIWGPKAKSDHLVLNAKLLLININYVDFFFFFIEIL